MLKDFVKLETFLTVARERSFSKASAKLGISQPAVTQQIKFIEKYLGCKTIERKKNGIKLTGEGEELYKIAARLEKEINSSEKDILKIINKEMTFRLGASYTIGTYVIPGECLNAMSEAINNDVNLSIDVSDAIERLITGCKASPSSLDEWLAWLAQQIPTRYYASQAFMEQVARLENNPQTMQRLRQKAVKIELSQFLN